jgi:tetratricopeptide (TPR) repeat protein
MVAGAAGGAAWWLLRGGAPGQGPGFNVLLITLDTTRADYLGCYGYPAGHTPNIDRLADEGTRFAQCTAAAPSTLPSHSSIMTATYPYVHGARDNGHFQLSERNLTLAEIFREAGYVTGAHTAAYVVNHQFGLAQGFDTYVDCRQAHERRGDAVCDEALGWLRQNGGQKFFLWVHFFDPHAPYEPPPRFRGRYDQPYVGEIAFADEQVGRLISELSTLGLEDKTLVVVTADHGEGLGQHAEETHLFFVYDTTLSVPLILRCPGRIPARRVVEAQVRLIDVAPTVLAFAGLRALPDAQGTDLLPLAVGNVDDLRLAAYGETLGAYLRFGMSPLRCLRVGGWKLIHAPTPELYNVVADPGETDNLASVYPERVETMTQRLRALIAQAPPGPTGGSSARLLGPEDVARLAALGYARGEVPTESYERELDLFEPVGPDPKDHTEAITTQGHAAYAMQTGRYAEAEAYLRQLLAEFPHSAGLAFRLARALFLQQRTAEALGVYERILAEHPDSAEAHYGIAKLLSRAGRLPEAIHHFRRAVEVEPEYAEACYDLGVTLRKTGHGVEALEWFRRAAEIRPTYVDARLNLGAGLAAQGQLEEAIRQYRQALSFAPDDAAIHYNLGNALLRKGDRTGAIRSYKEALRLKPDFTPARQALRFAQEGRSGGTDTP